MIGAVGVVVPARDEAELVGACLRSVLGSLRSLPASVESAVCVVADRCADGTELVARRVLAGHRRAVVVGNDTALTIGEVRDLGVEAVRTLLTGHRAERTLLLHTDADTVVTPRWAAEHVARCREGAHAVAGTARLSSPPTSRLARIRYRDVLARARRPEGHGNVYGANLGVRADAFAAVGGFGAVAHGEDHGLWRRLDAGGFRVRYDAAATVITSSRVVGRAPAGLAALLASLAAE
ncbi:glycosyltransferase [Actinoalloteichus spitiensis]|uniref:glycosyltransferase n=1 Tax=Actinoalloteichus spitiensis TaxID=252394 RepID=UPI0012F68DF5|nr:glycosyltransferase family A protein [Actinoalloteichus spitiensis]